MAGVPALIFLLRVLPTLDLPSICFSSSSKYIIGIIRNGSKVLVDTRINLVIIIAMILSVFFLFFFNTSVCLHSARCFALRK